MNSEEAKLFVGGLCRETSDDILKDYFSKYGTVLGSVIAKDRITNIPRGFGFVSFSNSSSADKALQDKHIILGRTVEVKKAIPRSGQQQKDQQLQEQHPPSQQHNSGLSKDSSNGNINNQFRTKKIFVGGLSGSLTEKEFKNYFEKFGKITDLVVMHDRVTHRPRGFGFVTFDSEKSVDNVMQKSFHELNSRLVEVKRAVPKVGLNGSNSHYNTRADIEWDPPPNKNFQPGNQPFYGPGYWILSGNAAPPGYSGVGGNFYGNGVYGGGYPMVGCGQNSYGDIPIVPRNSWNDPVLIGGSTWLLPYGSGYIYPTFLHGGYNGIVGLGKPNHILGSNDHLR